MAVAAGSTDALGYGRIVAMAIPIIAANCAAPLLGLADTAIIGNMGTATDLGAVALGSLLFNFIFWSFGFLRMGTTAFVAQALGRGDSAEVTATVVRGILLALLIGGALVALQWPLIWGSLALFGGDPAVEATARAYFNVRIWSAPAALTLYVLMGYLIGQGQSGLLLALQLLLNGLNIALDLVFAGLLGWGAPGIAAGTALAEWLTAGVAGWLVFHRLDRSLFQLPAVAWRQAILATDKLRQLGSVNANIMIRTLFLLLGFALFTDQGARFGTSMLAGNHILLQLISFSAFFLDGFAFTTEALAGRAFAAGDGQRFRHTIQRTTLLAAATALLLAGILAASGEAIIALLTQIDAVRLQASSYLPYCIAYVLLSFAAFQLDGVFLGSAQSRPLRNASIAATVAFACLCWLLVPALGNRGLWLAFIGYVVLRAMALGLYLPGLVRGPRARVPTGDY